MRKTERVVVYSLLAAALAMAAGARLTSVAEAGRSSMAPEAARIATIDALALVDLMLQSERYAPARETKVKELNDQMIPIGREVTDLESKLIMGKKDDPNRDSLVSTWQNKKQQMQQLQQALSADLDKFNSKQAAEAYDLVLSTTDALAKSSGYTHVVMTRKERNFLAENQAGTVQQLLSRPLVVWPAADDLTDLAIKELKLEGVSLDQKAKRDAAAGEHEGAPQPESKPQEK
jgi:Skp family chaperone for outer membrane proteins